MQLSIIIPVLNEADVLAQTLEGLESSTAEVIVVDGGSGDGTAELARRYTSKVIVSPRGRGQQQDAGARRAIGDVLLFLHGDTKLPPGYEKNISRTMADPQVVFGAFTLAIQPSSFVLKIIAFTANLRSRLLKLPYGDQAIFVRRTAYLEVGGFRNWPIMEDVELVCRLNRLGGFRLVSAPVQTSARRWEREKPVFTTFRNWSLIIRYFLGISPKELVKHYPDTR